MSEQKSVLVFDGISDHIELSKSFPDLDKAITIEFWAKGGNSLTEQTSILEAYNNQNIGSYKLVCLGGMKQILGFFGTPEIRMGLIALIKP